MLRTCTCIIKLCGQQDCISNLFSCLQAQKDLGFLMNPGEGPVTAVQLYVPPNTVAATHLFSGGADGTVAVWSAGPAWDCLKVCITNEVIFNVYTAV